MSITRKSKKTKRSIGPAGASIVSEDGKRIKNTSGDPNKTFLSLITPEVDPDNLRKEIGERFKPQKGVQASIPKKGRGKPKPKLQEEVDIPDVPVEKGATGPNMGQVAGGFKTLNVKKGGLIKKKKKSKVAGRLAKRGYGAARK